VHTKTTAQIEQEQIMEASGLLRGDIAVLYEECADELVEVESDLMDIAENKATLSPDFINRVFRAFHTVKGTASHLLHEPMKNLSQAAENVLSQVREGKLELSISVAEVLLSAVTRLQAMAADVDRRLEIDDRAELDRLKAVLKPEKPACILPIPPRSRLQARPPARRRRAASKPWSSKTNSRPVSSSRIFCPDMATATLPSTAVKPSRPSVPRCSPAKATT
jgi:chemotaxis protein histidine kinase CheA